MVYGDDRRYEVPVPLGRTTPDKSKVADELLDAVFNDRQPLHDGRWGMATLEVCLAILTSSRLRAEVTLQHQVAVPPVSF